ncbi:MAG: hypothetical protein C4B59_03845 [Candidatus Methanogaster sp.]|uniref:Uncharacterized protein n=1 Tax=Candidatus Methanogaster sp. TaxID=3386292 RepID=A0AC61L4A4_9EURY|nr:MAG: hypothetical protein C4B59_03845 [ANME-2 cluster archaeon]
MVWLKAIINYHYNHISLSRLKSFWNKMIRLSLENWTVPKFPEGIFKLNAWKQTEITITNTGSMHAKKIKIEPVGDIEFTRYEIPTQLDRTKTERIPIHMKPTVMGDVPIDITIAFKDALDREYASSKDLCVGM